MRDGLLSYNTGPDIMHQKHQQVPWSLHITESPPRIIHPDSPYRPIFHDDIVLFFWQYPHIPHVPHFRWSGQWSHTRLPYAVSWLQTLRPPAVPVLKESHLVFLFFQYREVPMPLLYWAHNYDQGYPDTSPFPSTLLSVSVHNSGYFLHEVPYCHHGSRSGWRYR